MLILVLIVFSLVYIYLATKKQGGGKFVGRKLGVGRSLFASKKHHGLVPVYGVRYFGSSSKNNLKPAMVYSNSDTQKLDILRDNKGKSGIYR